MRRHRSPHVSHVTRVDDEGNGRADFMCHMWMRERSPILETGLVAPDSIDTGLMAPENVPKG